MVVPDYRATIETVGEMDFVGTPREPGSMFPNSGVFFVFCCCFFMNHPLHPHGKALSFCRTLTPFMVTEYIVMTGQPII